MVGPSLNINSINLKHVVGLCQNESSTKPPYCPWSFLEPKSTPVAVPTKVYPKIFAKTVVQSSLVIDLSKLPIPIWRGEVISFKLDKDEYQQTVQECRDTFLIGRFIQPKGHKPLSLQETRLKLQKLWEPLGLWKATPIGRGFFNLHFSSLRISSAAGLLVI